MLMELKIIKRRKPFPIRLKVFAPADSGNTNFNVWVDPTIYDEAINPRHQAMQDEKPEKRIKRVKVEKEYFEKPRAMKGERTSKRGGGFWDSFFSGLVEGFEEAIGCKSGSNTANTTSETASAPEMTTNKEEKENERVDGL